MRISVEVLKWCVEASDRLVGWKGKAELCDQGVMLKVSKIGAKAVLRARILSWEQLAKHEDPMGLVANTLRAMTGSYFWSGPR